MSDASIEFDDLSGEEASESPADANYSDAVVHATDWTAETIVSQLEREKIALNPRFQRRDAWTVPQKSRFIESVIMGLPVPQIVLAELKGRRGNYLVLDGKQRLLSLLQFWGLGEGKKNSYALSGLKVLTHLNRKRLVDLKHDPEFDAEHDALLNQTIRTVVIRNWPDSNFLHMVFLRLNTGSMKLSPQELRQALQPGLFADWVDETAAESLSLRKLLGLREPDSRMRDTEVFARFVAFNMYASEYPGRLKRFLDETFEMLNASWEVLQDDQPSRLSEDKAALLDSFERAIQACFDVFSDAGVARRPGSRLLNRTILDMLLFYASDHAVAEAMIASPGRVREAYKQLFDDHAFIETIESDTASTANTVARLRMWGEALVESLGIEVKLPTLNASGPRKSIEFSES